MYLGMLDEFPPSYRFSHGIHRREMVVHIVFFPVSASPRSMAAAEAELVPSKIHQVAGGGRERNEMLFSGDLHSAQMHRTTDVPRSG